ncbi:unnamed protein product [Lathyrus oleraceus]|nr:magnesium transporter MRS2-3-like [Pisum sativum]
MMRNERVVKVTERLVSKKASKARTWLIMSNEGQRQTVEAGKPTIMQRTGLAARDLRILDPMLSYPSTIMGRDKAMVLNLEQIKAIVSAHEVLLLNSRDPSVVPFVEELHARILHHHSIIIDHSQDDEDKKDEDEIKQVNDKKKIIPFEFVVLEACLEDVISSLENEANILELEAYPALDKLTSKISTLNLERVRHIKSRLVALTARVQRVKDELENLLDDDGDMAELYLTNKLSQQKFENSSTVSSMNNNGDDIMMNQVLQPNIADRTLSESSLKQGGDLTDHDDSKSIVSGEIPKSQAGTVNSGVGSVEELEKLLGAYFVQIGSTLNKLSMLNEYVEDTEDYINITLDDKQNRILQTGVHIGTISVIVNSFIVVTGIFGMNIHIDIFNAEDDKLFFVTIILCTAACLILYFLAMLWYKKKHML